MNPYEVLGVKPDADMDTIKKAYRELAKKYHPDKYVNNPLADLASEKFKEINEAYDMITSGKASSGSNDSRGSSTYSHHNNTSGGGSSNSNTQNASYQLARSYIQRRQFAQARKCLAGLPQNAEWYYLNGVIYINQGWYDKGREFISQAVIMEPNNPEYNATLNSLLSTMSGYRTSDGMGGRHSYGLGTGPCDCCTQLLCADCLCECLGGDLISCC